MTIPARAEYRRYRHSCCLSVTTTVTATRILTAWTLTDLMLVFIVKLIAMRD